MILRDVLNPAAKPVRTRVGMSGIASSAAPYAPWSLMQPTPSRESAYCTPGSPPGLGSQCASRQYGQPPQLFRRVLRVRDHHGVHAAGCGPLHVSRVVVQEQELTGLPVQRIRHIVESGCIALPLAEAVAVEDTVELLVEVGTL